MSFFSKGTPYLTLFPRSGRLQFRIRIPLELQPCLGKREFRKSLGHPAHTDAKAQALKLAAAAHEVFSFTRKALTARAGLTCAVTAGKTEGTSTTQQMRKTKVAQELSANAAGDTSGLNGRALSSLSDDEIRSIADTWLLAALKGSDLFRLEHGHIVEELLREGASCPLDPLRASKIRTGRVMNLSRLSPRRVFAGSKNIAHYVSLA